MKLYLMQHALAFSAEEDKERPLTPEGIAQAKAAAKGIKRLGLTFELIIASPKRRARQTASLIAESVRFPYSDILISDALLPAAEPQALRDLLHAEPAASAILVVGHLPQLAQLAKDLLPGSNLLFANAGLVCIEIDESQPSGLRSMLTNQQLALL